MQVPGQEGRYPSGPASHLAHVHASRTRKEFVACSTLATPWRLVMCRPSCCNNTSGGPGGLAVAAVAVVVAAALVGPALARLAAVAAAIAHLVFLAVLLIAMLAVAAMVTMWIVRVRVQRRRASLPRLAAVRVVQAGYGKRPYVEAKVREAIESGATVFVIDGKSDAPASLFGSHRTGRRV
jgi:hypothetical protein